MSDIFTFERGWRRRMPLGGSSGGTRSADLALSWTGNVVGSGSRRKRMMLFILLLRSFYLNAVLLEMHQSSVRISAGGWVWHESRWRS